MPDSTAVDTREEPPTEGREPEQVPPADGGEVPPGQEPETPTAGGDGEERTTFDRTYVESLRREAAGYRTRAQTAEEKIRTVEQTANERIAEAQSRADALQTQVTDMARQQAVLVGAIALGFQDPDDAVRLLDPDAVIVGDDGAASGVDEALKALAAKKPHLLKGRATSDATSGAGSRSLDSDMNRAIRAQTGRKTN